MGVSFSDLKKNLKMDFSGLKEIKIAVLADSASQLFVQALKGYGFSQGLNLDIWEADYDQIHHTVIDDESELYGFQPQFIIIFQSSRKAQDQFYKRSLADKKTFADDHLRFVSDTTAHISNRLTCNIIYLNLTEINDSVFGNFSNKTAVSFLYQLRKINLMLMELAQQQPNLSICDINALQHLYGREFITSDRLYINTDNVFEIDALPEIVTNITAIIQAFGGSFKKCIILDLDNTVWGGIIGDDGIENIQVGDLGIGKAFTLFQQWIKQLKQRGIILAVCSKNAEHIAKEPFEKHPDMVLRPGDIAVFVANWENKVSNIRYIQSVLNIAFDSMVFVDDNPAEREMVKTNIPEITVPELPEDPAEYISFLSALNLFETFSFTEEDSNRTRQYQDEAGRNKLQNSFVNEESFLRNLQMKAVVKPMDAFTLPRVAQLTQRSNQFNLRTIRYTEEELKAVTRDKNKFVITLTLTDKFGDYGLICALILEKQNKNSLFIDTWIMSCRVLKRGVEIFLLNEITKLAKKQNCQVIIGEYLPTPKNELVKDHYKNLGFEFREGPWYLTVNNYLQQESFINA